MYAGIVMAFLLSKVSDLFRLVISFVRSFLVAILCCQGEV